jgi:hypothetical protein
MSPIRRLAVAWQTVTSLPDRVALSGAAGSCTARSAISCWFTSAEPDFWPDLNGPYTPRTASQKSLMCRSTPVSYLEPWSAATTTPNDGYDVVSGMPHRRLQCHPTVNTLFTPVPAESCVWMSIATDFDFRGRRHGHRRSCRSRTPSRRSSRPRHGGQDPLLVLSAMTTELPAPVSSKGRSPHPNVSDNLIVEMDESADSEQVPRSAAPHATSLTVNVSIFV